MPRSILRTLTALAVLAGLAAYATIMLRGPHGLAALEESRRQIRALEEQNANMLREIEGRRHRIEALKTDRSAQIVAVEKEQKKVPEGQTRFDMPGQRLTMPTPGSKPSPP
jgi:cell division protein FtsB